MCKTNYDGINWVCVPVCITARCGKCVDMHGSVRRAVYDNDNKS